MTTHRIAYRVLWVECQAPAAPLSRLLSAAPIQVDFIEGRDRYTHPSQATDAIVLSLSEIDAAALPAWAPLASACADMAVLVLTPAVDDALAHRLLAIGVQDVVQQAHAESLPQRLSLAVERKRLERELLKAHATDLKTGLPNRSQLIEHMSQLLALREREHRPVSVLVLRIDGFDSVEAGRDLETANVLRRKVAVRLRAGVRASDVVASLGANVFAVLLPAMESPADVKHVVAKLARAVRNPFTVAGQGVRLSTAIGAAHFPHDGKEPEALLRHASGLALLAGHGKQDAAND